MIDKILKSTDEAIADVRDGASIMFGGWAASGGMPIGLIRALVKKGSRNLTVISAVAGGYVKSPDGKWLCQAALIENGQIKKYICCYARKSATFGVSPAEDQYLKGELELEVMPQGTLIARIYISGAGFGGIYTPVGVGTVAEEGKEKKVIDGIEYLLELPLTADFAFIHAHKADRMGNLVYRGTSRAYQDIVAKAADIAIAEAEEIVETGELDPENIHTPSIYIDRVVKAEKEEILWMPRRAT